MKILQSASVMVLLLIGTAALDARGGEPPRSGDFVAVVCSLSGSAHFTLTPRQVPKPLRLFDWLPARSAIQVAPGSKLTLAFRSGLRYQLGENAKVTLGPSGLVSQSGTVRTLPPLPPLPPVLAVDAQEKAGPRAGAVRIRGERIRNLYPRDGARALAGHTVLRFTPVAGAGKYRVEIEDDSGKLAFATETELPQVDVGSQVLKPGQRYFWSVRTLDRVGAVARAEGEFGTLSRELEKSRTALKEAVEKEADLASLALLAEVDHRLGLLLEAREDLRAAVEKSSGDASLRAALEDLEQRLQGDRNASDK